MTTARGTLLYGAGFSTSASGRPTARQRKVTISPVVHSLSGENCPPPVPVTMSWSVAQVTAWAYQACTRGMAVTYLWKLAGRPAADAAFFADVTPEAAYAQAVAWAVAAGVTSGSGEGGFSPDNASFCQYDLPPLI